MINLTSPPIGVANDLLLAALQATADAVAIIDIEESIVWVNAAFTQLTGFSFEEALGQTFKINHRKDGARYHEELSITPLRDSRGNTSHYIAIQRDVTERERRVAQLEASPIGCYDMDAHGIILRANRAASDLLGYPAAEMVGRPFWEFVAPEERDEAREPSPGGVRERGYVSRSGARLMVEEHSTLEYGRDGQALEMHCWLVDITQRARSQAALRESQQRYHSLFVNSGDSIFVVDAKSRDSFVVEDVNPAFERTTGTSREAVIGKTPQELLPRERAEAMIRRYQECLELGQPVSYEEAVEFPRGVIYSEIQLIPIRDAAGRITRIAGFAHDLTKRLRVEAELRAKEEQLRLVIEASGHGFWDWDMPKGTLRGSRRWAEMQELPDGDQEFKTSHFLDLIHPEDLGQMRQLIQDGLAAEGSYFAVEYRSKAQDGWRWLLTRGRVVRWDENGAPLRATGTLTEITGRKLAEQRVRESEARYRSVVAALTEGILLQDGDGRVKACNGAAQQILGTTEAELKTRAPYDKAWDAIREDGSEFPAVERPSVVTLRTGERCLGVIRGYPKEDGSVQWLSVNSEPLIAQGETKPHGVVSSFTDITAQRRDLRELETARIAAEAAANAKSEFLACMSHEIRTPMNGILGMVELLGGTDLNAEQREYAECIHSSAEALITIINDILDFSKVDTGNVTLEQIPFSVRESIRNVTTLLRTQADKKSLTLRVSLAPELADLYVGDAGRFRQIVLNLTGNAVKFTSHGEVCVEAAPADGGMGIVLRVSDTGIGIAPDYLPMLFTQFSQADGSTARRYGGTGLGLAISKKLIDLMGGTIEVVSEQGRGSVFTVTLPLAPSGSERR